MVGTEEAVVRPEEEGGTPSKIGIMSGEGSLQASRITDHGVRSHRSNQMQHRALR